MNENITDGVSAAVMYVCMCAGDEMKERVRTYLRVRACVRVTPLSRRDVQFRLSILRAVYAG